MLPAGLSSGGRESTTRGDLHNMMKALGFAAKSWNDTLKKNGCWDERLAQPYAGN